MTTLRERLADLEHARWAHWQSYLHGLCEQDTSGALKIPAENVARWERQIATRYPGLSEREKNSDRAEADKTIEAVIDWLRDEFPDQYIAVIDTIIEAMREGRQSAHGRAD